MHTIITCYDNRYRCIVQGSWFVGWILSVRYCLGWILIMVTGMDHIWIDCNFFWFKFFDSYFLNSLFLWTSTPSLNRQSRCFDCISCQIPKLGLQDLGDLLYVQFTSSDTQSTEHEKDCLYEETNREPFEWTRIHTMIFVRN